MTTNESTSYMEVKLEVYNKRPESLKFRSWTQCQVQIEPIKCFPCFLRITIQSLDDPMQRLTVTINVPGITVSLATSRTKLYTYGLLWTHNRHDCFIYFALETDMLCRKHMRWLQKSIKNLEMHRQIVLEHRRMSRSGTPKATATLTVISTATSTAVATDTTTETAIARTTATASASIAMASCPNIDLLKKSKEPEQKPLTTLLGPLPQIPSNSCLNESFNKGESYFQMSDIYEEISDGIESSLMSQCHLSSRSSAASGIYEEMNSLTIPLPITTPPPPPPLPPPRKRLNTYETELKVIGVNIRRSNTTPESDMYKKKKYRSFLDIFNTARGKRADSVNEKYTTPFNDLVNEQKENESMGQSNEQSPPRDHGHHQYHNKQFLLSTKQILMESNKRNSVSSPDFSKINLFDDEKISDSSKIQSSNDLFDDWATAVPYVMNKDNRESVESLNISEQLSLNFNFSAPNSSSVNLLGAQAAVPTIHHNDSDNNVINDSLSGYCIMAPLKQNIIDEQKGVITAVAVTSLATAIATTDVARAEKSEEQEIEEANSLKLIKTIAAMAGTTTTYSSGTSGCLTDSHSPITTSSLTNSNYSKLGELEAKLSKLNNHYDVIPMHKLHRPITNNLVSNDSTIYENMEAAISLNGSNTKTLRLYENIIQSISPKMPPIKATIATTAMATGTETETSTVTATAAEAAGTTSSIALSSSSLLSSSTFMNKNVTQDLYENLLAIKASQELGQESFIINDCTSSTPTETNHLNDNYNVSLDKNYNNSVYETPRRNVINVDEKISSYYPNTTGTKKMQRNHHLRKKQTEINTSEYYLKGDNNVVEKQKYLKNVPCINSINNKTSETHLYKSNVYITSPIYIMGQRYYLHSNKTALNVYTESLDKNIFKTPKCQKVPQNVYTVNVQGNKNSFESNYKMYNKRQIFNNRTRDDQMLKENFDNDLNFVKNIDFKFDDPKHVVKHVSQHDTDHAFEINGIENFKRAENEYEKYYVASKNAAKLLTEFATLMPMKQQKQRNVYLMSQSSSTLISPSPSLSTSSSSSTSLSSSTSSSSSTSLTIAGNHGGIESGISTTPKISTLEGMTMTTKRFASLPCFKKFDLSPLRLKINNVLQRQHSPNLSVKQSSETK